MSAAQGAASDAGLRRRRWIALAAITLLAGLLRLLMLRQVPDNLYYDAAVRSMEHSLHDFLYGAFEPGGSASIDKPPLDLWLQVISVKLLGFGSVALKLPEALAGTLAVPLLYDLVRRIAGTRAALMSAATLAVMPVSVITSRSDTMDSVMMLTLVAVAWLLVRSAQQGERRWLLAAAAVLGIAFNVKLFEALVPLPAFLMFLLLCRRERLGTLLRQLGLAAGVFVAVACSWLAFVSLTPASERPYPIGSTNGSVWNAVFVYNGLDRITQAPRPKSFSTTSASVHAVAHAARASRHAATTTISQAGPLRLFEHSLVDFGGLVGTLLFAALLFGALALAPRLRRGGWPVAGGDREASIERAAVAALAVWLLSGYALFSFTSRVHPRYLEAFTPAIAVTLALAVPVLVQRARDLFGVYVLLTVLVVGVLEAVVTTGTGLLVRAGLAFGVLIALAVGGVLIGALLGSTRGRPWPAWASVSVVSAGVLASLLAFPLSRDVRLIRDHSGVQAAEPTLAASLVASLSHFLVAHQGAARYEFAASAPTVAAPLIVAAGRPVLLLSTVDARPLVTLVDLRRAVSRGEVRYVFAHGSCPTPPYHLLPSCSTAVRWVRAHARDVTAQLGLAGVRSGLLYDLRALH